MSKTFTYIIIFDQLKWPPQAVFFWLFSVLKPSPFYTTEQNELRISITCYQLCLDFELAVRVLFLGRSPCCLLFYLLLSDYCVSTKSCMVGFVKIWLNIVFYTNVPSWVEGWFLANMFNTATYRLCRFQAGYLYSSGCCCLND